MPIDRSQIKWDSIDPSKVKWDDAEPDFAQSFVDYFTKPVAPAPANVQAQGYDPLAAYAERVAGNVPASALKAASGFTAPALQETASALYNRPIATLAGMGSAALQGAGQFITDPLNTFAQDPIGTVMGLQGARLATVPGRAAVNMLAQTAYPMARRAVSPANRMLADVFGKPDIQAALQGAPAGTSVPQALADVNAPKAQAVVKQAMSLQPEETRAAQLAQQQSRLEQLSKIGKTPQELASAIEERAASAKKNYSLAFKQVMQETPELTAIMNRPSMEKAFSRAAEIAKERAKPFQLGKTTPETITESKILDEFGAPVQKVTPAEIAKYPVQSLHYVKKALDDMVLDPETFGIGASEVAAINDTRREFIKQLENNSAYARARAEYAAQSIPINKMQVVQQLAKTVTEPVAEEATRAGMFARAIEEAPTTIKKSTGQQFFKKLDDILSPEEMEVVNNIRDEFRRTKLSEEQARQGAKAAPEVEELASANVTTGLPKFLNSTWTLANSIVKRSLGTIDQKLAIKIATMMQDRAELNQAIAAAKKYEQETAKTVGKLKSRRKEITNVTPPQLVSGAVSVQNTLAPERQNAMAPR